MWVVDYSIDQQTREIIMARNPFIQSGEVFLIIWEIKGVSVIAETTSNGEISIEECFDDACQFDSVQKLVRFDLKTLNTEDVTEEIAEYWLSDHLRESTAWDYHHGVSNSSTVPDYVLNSDTYENMIAEGE